MTDTSAKRRGCFVASGCFLLLAIAGIAAIIGFHTIYSAMADAKYEDTKQRAIAAGFPASIADITPDPIPDDQNAALDIWKLYDDMTPQVHPVTVAVNKHFRSFSAFTYGSTTTPKPINLSNSDCRTLLTQLAVPPLDAFFATAETMASKPGFVAPTKFQVSDRAAVPHLPHMREMAKMLAFRAWLHARVGDSQAATHDIQRIFALATHLHAEPILVSGLYSISMDGIAVSSIQAIMRDTGPHAFTPDQLKSLIQTIRSHRHPQDNARLASLLEGQFINYADQLQVLREERFRRSIVPAINSPLSAILFKPLWLEDFGAGTNRFIQLRDQARLPHNQAVASELPPLPKNLGSQVSRYCTEILRMAYRKYIRHETQLAVTEAGLLVLLWHDQRGSYPTSSQVATSFANWPNNPFTDTPLSYQKLPKGYIISVTPTFKDGANLPITWQIPATN